MRRSLCQANDLLLGALLLLLLVALLSQVTLG